MRSLVVTALVVVTAVGTATTAAARTPETWTEPEPMSVAEVLGLFVGVPVLLLLLIVAGVYASQQRRGPRYRPDQEWWAEPAWLGAPTGVRADELPPGTSETGETPETPAVSAGERGGASARW